MCHNWHILINDICIIITIIFFMDLIEIKNQVIENAFCSEQDVKNIEFALYDGDGMDTEKGSLLFDIKNSLKDKNSAPDSFSILFVEAICKLLLDDDISPGELMIMRQNG